MRSSSGTSAARDGALAVLAAILCALAPTPARAIDYDAIFYRARAGFDFCYRFSGTAGWSLRRIEGGRIVHDGDAPCPTVGLTDSQLAATNDCVGGICHADCAAFVRRSWAAGAEEALRTLAAAEGGNCADPSGFGAERFVRADEGRLAISEDLEDARPGDWCSHADHVVMLLRRPSPNASRWIIWEANSSASGIGQNTLALDSDWLRTIVRDDCKWTEGRLSETTWKRPDKAWANSGCWHPAAERTGPPVDLELIDGLDSVDQDGVTYVDHLDRLVFRFRRPVGLPALADYVIWVRWRSGGPDDAPTYAHRVARIPAFSKRDDAERRLASFPGVPAGVRDFPLDVDEASVIEVRYADLAAAPAALVTGFRNPTTGATAEAWRPGQGLTPIVAPVHRQDGIPLAPGRSFAWRVRVERYGELSADGRRRTAVIPGCDLDADGVEQTEYCRDPMWSEEHRFTVVCAEDDDSCPRSGPVSGEVCSPAPQERPEDGWTSGCAQVVLASDQVNADDFVDVTVTTHGGICSGTGVWALPSDYAIFDGAEVREPEQSYTIYDFCTGGPDQPKPAGGDAVVVRLPDEWTGLVRFHVPQATGSQGCIDYVGPDSGGTCHLYSGGTRPQGQWTGPMVVAGGYGGTHGWSTVRMFSVVPAKIAADPGTP